MRDGHGDIGDVEEGDHREERAIGEVMAGGGHMWQDHHGVIRQDGKIFRYELGREGAMDHRLRGNASRGEDGGVGRHRHRAHK